MSVGFEIQPPLPTADSDSLPGLSSDVPFCSPHMLLVTDFSKEGPEQHTAVVVSSDQLAELYADDGDAWVQLSDMANGEYVSSSLHKADALPLVWATHNQVRASGVSPEMAIQAARGAWLLKLTLPQTTYLKLQ